MFYYKQYICLYTASVLSVLTLKKKLYTNNDNPIYRTQSVQMTVRLNERWSALKSNNFIHNWPTAVRIVFCVCWWCGGAEQQLQRQTACSKRANEPMATWQYPNARTHTFAIWWWSLIMLVSLLTHHAKQARQMLNLVVSCFHDSSFVFRAVWVL